MSLRVPFHSFAGHDITTPLPSDRSRPRDRLEDQAAATPLSRLPGFADRQLRGDNRGASGIADYSR
jgi:hypothetical protein